MSIYTFYCRKPDGAPGAFAAFELDSDEAAAAQAVVLLEQHMSAAEVEVYERDRKVLTRSRRVGRRGRSPIDTQHPMP